MPWWGWIVVGAVLLVSEVAFVDADFYLVFLGLSAILVGLIGLGGAELSVWLQWLIFAGLSIISMVTFRKQLYKLIRGGIPDFQDSLIGETVRISEALPPGESCRVELRGTTWTVCNNGESVIAPGSLTEISGVDGLVLKVSPPKSS